MTWEYFWLPQTSIGQPLLLAAGAAVAEISATLPTVGMHMRMPGLEQAVLKVDGRQCVFKRRSPAPIPDVQVEGQVWSETGI